MMRYFWLSYHAASRETRHAAMPSPYNFDLHHVRDGAPFAEIAATLGNDYEYGGLLLNLPRRRSPEHLDFRATDLLVLPTRPPMDDRRQGDKRTIPTSGSWLEQLVFRGLPRFFKVCSRSHIILSSRVARLLPNTAADHGEIVFRQSTGAWCERYRAIRNGQWVEPASQRTTAGYLAYLPRVWPNGPRLLAVFGLGGLETLVWAHLLRYHNKSTVQAILASNNEQLLIGEFTIPRNVPSPVSLRFAQDASATVIARVHLPTRKNGRP
jgi:hypothetical protein